MMVNFYPRLGQCLWAVLILGAITGPLTAQTESPYLYGIHDADPSPQEFLNRLTSGGTTGWITATVAIGSNAADTSGSDFRSFSNQGHTMIVRLNNDYCPGGTIPVVAKYGDFAQRCANYVAATKGADLFIIGNETNLASEWPVINGQLKYVSPQSYADCFRQCYTKIKAARPTAKVIVQALAPWAGPYGAGNTCGYPHEGNSLNWVQYMNQMLTAIKNSGPGPDGIALHITSRGFQKSDIYSTETRQAGGQTLYWSFYVYKDWINLGIPSSMYNLPLYATECVGNYYWKGGHQECSSCSNPSCCYQPGWVQEIFKEINRWNNNEGKQGKPVFRCVNFYRWCAWCDGWNIDGSPQKGQILSDLEAAVALKYRWDTGVPAPIAGFTGSPTSGQKPLTVNFTDQSTGQITSRSWTFGDGGTSTATNSSRTYTTAGTYTVALTVTGPGGSNTATRNNYITVNEPPSYMGDFDLDNDVDMQDFGVFQRCMSGSGIPQNDPACERARLDMDSDVDQDDFALFQACLSGANRLPPASCLK